MVCHVYLFFFHLCVIWQSDRWSLGCVLGCIHTLCVICHYIQVIVWSQWQRDWVGHSLTTVSASYRLSEETRISSSPSPPSLPLYHDNPSFICYIAYYLHDNWCLIFYPSTPRRKEVSLSVSGCTVYFISLQQSSWFFFFLPWAPIHFKQFKLKPII